jgi:dTDP-4-dehydrorhamnose 3,5-epimerase
MNFIKTKFKDLIVFKGKRFLDSRGYFREILKAKVLPKKKMIFWCLSKSKKNVLRGLHLQKKNQQEKFVSVIKGKILDVVVDLRKNSKTFGKNYKIILSEQNCKSIFIPKGFAHGFLGIDKENIIVYGNSNYRSKNNEIGLMWNDKNLAINWPNKKFIISKKDRNNLSFKEFVNQKINL